MPFALFPTTGPLDLVIDNIPITMDGKIDGLIPGSPTGRTPRNFRPAWAKDGGTFGPATGAYDPNGSDPANDFAELNLAGPGGRPATAPMIPVAPSLGSVGGGSAWGSSGVGFDGGLERRSVSGGGGGGVKKTIRLSREQIVAARKPTKVLPEMVDKMPADVSNETLAQWQNILFASSNERERTKKCVPFFLFPCGRPALAFWPQILLHSPNSFFLNNCNIRLCSRCLCRRSCCRPWTSGPCSASGRTPADQPLVGAGARLQEVLVELAAVGRSGEGSGAARAKAGARAWGPSREAIRPTSGRLQGVGVSAARHGAAAAAASAALILGAKTRGSGARWWGLRATAA